MNPKYFDVVTSCWSLDKHYTHLPLYRLVSFQNKSEGASQQKTQ